MSRTFLFSRILLFRNVLRMEVLTIVNGKTGGGMGGFLPGVGEKKK